MNYNNFKDKLQFLDTTIKVEDKEECARYEALLKENKDGPKGITYITKYDDNGNRYYEFYRKATNEEIKTLIEIANAKSLKRTGDALHFFKMLTIWSMIIGAVSMFFMILFSL